MSTQFPTAMKVGVADGAKTNWPFLTKHTERQILEFYHATEYLTNVADAQFAGDPRARKQWLDNACTSLKHDPLGSQALIAQMQDFLTSHLQLGLRGKIKAALTYFQNQQPFMNYAQYLEQNCRSLRE